MIIIIEIPKTTYISAFAIVDISIKYSLLKIGFLQSHLIPDSRILIEYNSFDTKPKFIIVFVITLVSRNISLFMIDFVLELMMIVKKSFVVRVT
jgi:hypothetical protein